MEQLFRKKLCLLLGTLLLLSFFGGVIIKLSNKSSNIVQENKITIVTSFYPMYIILQNLADNIDGVEVLNLTENQTGCLHDYQLTTKDMTILSLADIFVMNGGGMEEFIEGTFKNFPDINVIVASEGMEFLEGIEHDHEHQEASEEGHEEGNSDFEVINGHVWMSIDLYIQQVDQILNGLLIFDPENQNKYKENANVYLEKLYIIKEKIAELSEKVKNMEVVAFHEAFLYLAKSLEVEIVHILNLDEDSSLKAGEVAEVIDEMQLHQVKYLWTEEQFVDSIVASIVAETNANILILDTLTTGIEDKNSYINEMLGNIAILESMLED